jgi:hypothetical protein
LVVLLKKRLIDITSNNSRSETTNLLKERDWTIKKSVIEGEEHCEKTRRVTSKERILEHRLGPGLEPLCSFLDEDMLEAKFPRIQRY